MRRWLAVALVACSSKKSPPPPPSPAPVTKGDAAVAIPAATLRTSNPIDLPDTTITQLQLLAVMNAEEGGYEPQRGTFALRWQAPEPEDVEAVCRIEAYNLACAGKRDEPMVGKYEAMFRVDPFVLDPKVCEVRFFDAHRKVVARACYQDGTMTAGPCPAGAFPLPKLPDGMAIDMQGVSAHAMPRALEVRALVSTGASQQPELAMVCDGISTGAAVPLPAIDAGETRFVTLAVAMEKPLDADPKQCELRVSAKGKTLGTFCLAEGETHPGACEAK